MRISSNKACKEPKARTEMEIYWDIFECERK